MMTGKELADEALKGIKGQIKERDFGLKFVDGLMGSYDIAFIFKGLPLYFPLGLMLPIPSILAMELEFSANRALGLRDVEAMEWMKESSKISPIKGERNSTLCACDTCLKGVKETGSYDAMIAKAEESNSKMEKANAKAHN